jgi:hypothetical protein
LAFRVGMVEPQPPIFSEIPDTANAAAPDSGTPANVRAMQPARVQPVREAHDEPAERVNFQQSLRPILQGVEAMARAQFEQVGVLDRVEKMILAQDGVAKILTDTKAALEQRNVVNKAMFEVLHGELKTYKDAFLLESVLRPVIRDLISLFDDIFEIHRQLMLALTSQGERGKLVGSALILFENVAAPAKQLEHNRDAIIEVLERLDVTLTPLGSGKLDKQSQRAMSVELTDDPEQDNEIVKVSKRGFMWKDRVMRPEEVVIKKWKGIPQPAAEKHQAKP